MRRRTRLPEQLLTGASLLREAIPCRGDLYQSSVRSISFPESSDFLSGPERSSLNRTRKPLRLRGVSQPTSSARRPPETTALYPLVARLPELYRRSESELLLSVNVRSGSSNDLLRDSSELLSRHRFHFFTGGDSQSGCR